MHAVEANNEISTNRIKSRWSDEALMLTKAEAELITRRVVRFMNQELAGMFDDRSLEAIKKKQSPRYKQIVKNFLDALAGPVSPLPPSASSKLKFRLRSTTRSVEQQISTAPTSLVSAQSTISDLASLTAGTSASSQTTASH
ncbi:hypothetical protein AVEN_16323-1 [Araneus ventricosus]|uniref:Uncharacterized protein n=1 Tax=Araneus ventricosus TaxID=182803 RepID=A0A4Y2TK08_ARAVE|nr:hypothetical protein AVEN_16323-1 [Araneus ventricosus]